MIRKFKCSRCGEVFDEENSETVSQKVGEFWGSPAYENYIACPRCRETDIEPFEENEEE